VPDPISELIEAGRWLPAEEVSAPMVDALE
jgi:hypothetical protein